MGRIGIDARIYGAKRGGIGRYTQELLRVLPSVDRKNTYVVFMRPQDLDSYCPSPALVEKIPADIREYSFVEQVDMPALAYKANVDLLHVPHINVPYLYRGPLIVTAHDLIEYKYDRADFSTLSPLMYKLKRGIFRKIVGDTFSRAKKIIAVSRWTREEIKRTFPGISTPVEVIPHGMSHIKRYKAGMSKPPFDFPYLLYVGGTAPHKNLQRLLFVYKDAVGKEGIFEHLVLVVPHNFHTQRLRKFWKTLPLKTAQRVHFIHDADDKHLARYFHHARLYVSPSLEEGYNFPAIEALACGTPVLSSFSGAVPEVAGMSAQYWNANNVAVMRKKLVDTLHAPSRPFHALQLPSWREVALRHVRAYNETLKDV